MRREDPAIDVMEAARGELTMNHEPFSEAIKKIYANRSEYDPEAYFFVRSALDFTAKQLNRKNQSGVQRHLTGQELIEGIRQFALFEFGPMSFSVLKSWGINRTEDFGEIVFNLIEAGKLGCTAEDKKEDFGGGYDFHDAFEKPFLPENGEEIGVKS